MITFITHLRVSAENAGAFEALMQDVCVKVRENEPDVLYYDFAVNSKDSTTYVVVEVYRDDAAHAAHMKTDWIRSSIPKTTQLIENGKYDIKRYISSRREVSHDE